jgi:short-subunit dehydrogenase
MAKGLYSVEFITENGEPDGYFVYLTARQAEDVKDRLKKAADMYELGGPRVFQVDLSETPDFKAIMDALEDRYPS